MSKMNTPATYLRERSTKWKGTTMNLRVVSQAQRSRLPLYLVDAGYQKIQETERCLWPFYQIVCCYQGEGSIIIRGRELALSSSTFLYLPPNTEHVYVEHSTSYYVSWVSFDGTLARSLSECYEVEVANEPIVMKDLHHPDLHLHVMSVLELVDTAFPAERISVLLYGILTEMFLRVESKQEGTRHHSDRRIDQAIGWMKANIGQPADIGTLARGIGVSRQHLNRVFQHAFGTSTKDFYMKLKILQAQKDLIHFPERSVRDIGFSLGFVNESHFAKCFRKVAGVSPTSFRKADNRKR